MALSIAILILSLLPFTTASCYWPNGADRNAAYNASANGTLTLSYYQPCPLATPTSLSFSMCCAAGNTCQPNGLCWSSGAGIYWRESCSDPSWESAACVKLFVNGTGAYNDIQITECADGSFCYGNGNEECCARGEGVWIVEGEQEGHNFNSSTSSVVPGVASSSAATSTMSSIRTATRTTSSASSRIPTSTSSTATPPIPNSTLGPSPSLSPSTIAGISVAITLIFLLAIAIAIWFLLRRRRNKAPTNTDSGPAETKDNTWKWQPQEVHAEPCALVRQEMDGGKVGVGVDGQSKRGVIGVAELGEGKAERRELAGGI